MAQDIGRVAYQKYCEVILKGTAPQPHLDKWEDMGKVQQDAWRHAAVEVLQHMDWEREQSEKGLIG